MELEFGKHLPPGCPVVARDATAAISGDEVRAQLERILASTEFRVPNRTKDFLRYIVRESLEGRADRLKAYSIALEVFERRADFDAQQDPVVRTEAGRLRQALERYYLVAGQKDPILISVPKGGYIPVYERVHGGSASTSAAAPQANDSALRRAGGMAFEVISVALIALLAGWIASSEFHRNLSVSADAACKASDATGRD